MGLFNRFRRSSTGQTRVSDSADEKHLREWAAARRGVEGFLEPQTAVSSVTLLLVAHDFCNRLGIPSYDAAVVGIPARMREFNRRQSQKKPGNNFY